MYRNKRVAMLVISITMILVAGSILITAVPVQAATYPVLRVGSRGAGGFTFATNIEEQGVFYLPQDHRLLWNHNQGCSY